MIFPYAIDGFPHGENVVLQYERQPTRFCWQDGCDEQAVSCCDSCDHPFCGEHGMRGGDVEVEGGWPVARPSVCDECGGVGEE